MRTVIKIAKVVSDKNKDGKMLVATDGRCYFLDNKESHPEKLELNRIIYIWITKEHDTCGHCRVTLDGTFINEYIKSITELTFNDYSEINGSGEDLIDFINQICNDDKAYNCGDAKRIALLNNLFNIRTNYERLGIDTEFKEWCLDRIVVDNYLDAMFSYLETR